MVNGKSVTIKVGDVPVEGEIMHRFDNDIEVKITRPYAGLHNGSHIPIFARSVDSYDGKYGDSAAEYLLKNLYLLAEYTEKNLETLHEKYQAVKNKIDEMSVVEMTREKFLRKRKELRNRMKDGDIDKKEYGKKVQILRRKMDNFSLAMHRCKWEFFEKNFPMTITYGTPEQLAPFIEKKASLKTEPGLQHSDLEHHQSK